MSEFELQALRETLLRLSKLAQDMTKLQADVELISEMVTANNLAGADPVDLLGMTILEWNTVRNVGEALRTAYDTNTDEVLQAATRYRALADLVRG